MSSTAKAPVLNLDDSSRTVAFEKLKASTVDAIPLSFVPTALLTESFLSLAPRGHKEKNPVVNSDLTTVSFKIPSNFMVDDTVEKSKIFPHLGKYLLSYQQERFKDASIEDIDANATVLSFLVSLCRTTISFI